MPIGLRSHGDRKAGGRASPRADYSAAKLARIAERTEQQRRRGEAAWELGSHAGDVHEARLSDEARAIFLELYGTALAEHGRPLMPGVMARGGLRIADLRLGVELKAAAGATVRLKSPSGVLTLRDLSVVLVAGGADSDAGPGEWRAQA